MTSAASSSWARLDELRHVCRSWLYSFSKRFRRRAGSLAKSLRELADDSGVWARRRDQKSMACIDASRVEIGLNSDDAMAMGELVVECNA